jgi:alpha-glucosidase
MRLATLHELRASEHDELQFSTPRQEILRINVLDHDLIRVRFCPEGQPRLDRTWMVVGQDGDAPREGRSRDDLSPFPCPNYQTNSSNEAVVVETEALKLAVNLNDARIEWSSAAGQSFAADLRHRA